MCARKPYAKLLKVDQIHLLQVAASLIFRVEKNLPSPFSDNYFPVVRQNSLV